ncbi:unnamed protein product, partial [Cylicocyclus nassatus]
MFPAIIAERTFASRYISDYERTDRSWISYSVITGSFLCAVIYYIFVQSFFVGMYSMVLFTIVTLSICVLSSVVMKVVHGRDMAKFSDLANQTGRSTIHYTLSMKFQLAENLRVTK